MLNCPEGGGAKIKEPPSLPFACCSVMLESFACVCGSWCEVVRGGGVCAVVIVCWSCLVMVVCVVVWCCRVHTLARLSLYPKQLSIMVIM